MNQNFTSMSDFISRDRKEEIKCPVCGKMFNAAPEHSYTIGYGEKRGKNKKRLVCTYSCMRKWEKEQAEKPKKTSLNKAPVQRRNIPYKSVAVRIVETGETFSSLDECAKHLNTVGSNIGYGLKTGKGYKGYHFEKVEEGDTE